MESLSSLETGSLRKPQEIAWYIASVASTCSPALRMGPMVKPASPATALRLPDGRLALSDASTLVQMKSSSIPVMLSSQRFS